MLIYYYINYPGRDPFRKIRIIMLTFLGKGRRGGDRENVSSGRLDPNATTQLDRLVGFPSGLLYQIQRCFSLWDMRGGGTLNESKRQNMRLKHVPGEKAFVDYTDGICSRPLENLTFTHGQQRCLYSMKRMGV